MELTLTRTEPERDWRRRARCAGVDPEIFFPDRHQPRAVPEAWCTRCPVQESCLIDALDAGDDGIRGGTTLSMRTRRYRPALARLRGHAVPEADQADTPAPAQPAFDPLRVRERCGTDYGYHEHLREREPTCGGCRAAHASRAAERAAAARRRQAA